jgi:Domain of unknown function (DUF4260)
MKNLLKIEELFMFLLGLYMFSLLDYPWWLFAALFLAPDIGLLGYLINNKAGAFCYNTTHHKGLAIAVYLGGVYFISPILMLVGTIMFAHSSFDRILGYGLKYFSNFKETHLGTIGNIS